MDGVDILLPSWQRADAVATACAPGFNPPKPRSGRRWAQAPAAWLSRTLHTLAKTLSRGSDAVQQQTKLLEVYAGVATLAGQMVEDSLHIHTASNQLATQNKALSDSVWASNRAVEEILQIATQTGAACEQSSVKIAQARGLLETSYSAVGDRTHLIDNLIASVEKSHAGFREVDASVEEVERLLVVIQVMSNQTNLLALNAAIEAARAGQYGTGFSVVASEMRLLADKTGTASKQIRSITERMRASTGAASASIQLVSQTSSLSREQGERASQDLNGCIAVMHDAERTAGSLAVAARRQTDAIEQINRNSEKTKSLGRDCTWGADVAAETSIPGCRMAADLCDRLASLGTQIAAADELENPQLASQSAALQHKAATCRNDSGLNELERMRPSIEQALQTLRNDCTRLGAPSRRGRMHRAGIMPELCFGGRSLNLQNEQVDSLYRSTGFTATLYVLAEEEDSSRSFYRVASSLRLLDGGRSIGSQLNPTSNVAHRLLRAEPTYDYAYPLARRHVAAYQPIMDAQGELIGAFYVGWEVKTGNSQTPNGRVDDPPSVENNAGAEWW